MLYRTRARRCAITAPMKYNTRPVAAAIPMAGGPMRPPRSPIAPASFRVPNIGSQERGKCTLAEFASTKPAGMKSGIATAAVAMAVITVTTYRLMTLVSSSTGTVRRMWFISLTAFAWER